MKHGMIAVCFWWGLACQTVHAQQAVAYQSDAAHAGNSNLVGGLTLPLKRAWARTFEGPVSYPVVGRGLVFVTVGTHGSGKLVALSLQKGRQIWQRPIWDSQSNNLRATNLNATYDNGRVFVLTTSGRLEAITADHTGQVVWTRHLSGQGVFSGPPTAYRGKVYVNGYGFGTTIYAIDEQTGRNVWTQFVSSGGDGSPAIRGDGVYVVYPRQYYRFSPANGEIIWNDDLGGDGGGGFTPVLFNARLYGRELEQPGLNPVLAVGNGAELALIHASLTSPVFFLNDQAQTMIVQLGYDRILYCMNLQTSQVAWTFHGTQWNPLMSAPLLVNGMVMEGDWRGKLYVIDAQTGKVRWTGNVGSRIQPPDEHNHNAPLTGFAAAVNTILIPATNKLVAYRPSEPK